MNLSYSVFPFPLAGQSLGLSKGPNSLWTSRMKCQCCGKMILQAQGIFCANMSSKRGSFRECRGVWCGECYRLPNDNYFKIRKADAAGNNPDNNILVEEEPRFLTARNGDHFCTRFQCDRCQFINIHSREPMSSGSDQLLLKFIRRATLDAFWSREPTTIAANRSTFNQTLRCLSFLHLEPEKAFPLMGPFPIEDSQGYAQATCLLVRSLDPGKNEETIQFESTRKIRTVFSNLWHASLSGSDVTAAV